MNPVPFVGSRGWQPRQVQGYTPRRLRNTPFLANILSRPLNFRVYSRSSTTATLLWEDVSTGETGFEIERESPVGGGFSNITTTAAGVVTFEDTGLTAGTTYQYRIRTTDGVNTSVYTTTRSAVAVAPSIVTTHSCPTTGPFHKELSLPRFTEAPEEWRVLLNELAEKLEQKWNEQVVKEPECVICETNTGALVIDCSRCNNFRVTTDEDINSITVEHCEEGSVVLTVVNSNPSGGQPITVCGWPTGFKCVINNAVLHDDARCCTTVPAGTSKRVGFLCRANEICLPDDTKEDEVVFSTGGGGTGCGDLRIECETVEQGSLAFNDAILSSVTCAPLDCTSAAPRSDFRARCGMPPYTWTVTTPLTGGAAPVTTESDSPGHVAQGGNDKIRIAPGGTGTGTSLAYVRELVFWQGSGPCANCNTASQGYRCDGTTFGSCNGQTCSGSGCNALTPTCKLVGQSCTPDPDCPSGVQSCTGIGGPLADTTQNQCDVRQQSDKDSGTCEPCALNLGGDGSGAVVLTVTDAAGDSVSITIGVTSG